MDDRWRRVEINGETRCLNDWYGVFGVYQTVFHGRLKRGWSELEAITTPPDPKHHPKPRSS